MAATEKTVFAEERRREIVRLVNAERKIVIPELCNRFGVSASTVRNDLRDLQEEGLITRTHGGAISNSKSGFEPPPLEKKTHMAEAKRAIGRAAAALVENGDIIAIGTGTTTLEMARSLDPDLELTVILNDIRIAALLERSERRRIILLGGTLRNNFHYARSLPGGDGVAGFNIDKAFISCNGVDVRRGVTTPDPALAHDTRRIVGASSETYVLADSSKLGTVTFSRIADAREVAAVITDAGAGEDDVAAMRNAGIEVIVAGAGTREGARQ